MAMKTLTIEQAREQFPKTAEKWEMTRKYAPAIIGDLKIHGSWLWIDLNGEHAMEATEKALELLGYKWNATRVLYQNSCGSKRKWRRSSRRYEPRDKYGETQITA